MKIIIDTESKKISIDQNGKVEKLELFSKRGFELLSEQWLKIGWNQKYPYSFSWFGRPIIQIPEDIVRMQEAIYQIKPDVILETGVAHGGSLIFYASLCKAMGRGRVIGIDIEIRPHNRSAIEAHELSPMIELIEGSSVAKETVAKAAALIKPGEKVMVVLDSNHTRDHVSEEIRLYEQFVSPGSYLVVTDGSMQILHDVPRGKPEWVLDNPVESVKAFLKDNSQFKLENPVWPFNESELTELITHWPSAWLKRKK